MYACDEDGDEDTNEEDDKLPLATDEDTNGEHDKHSLAAVGITDTIGVRDAPGVATGVEKEARKERRRRERRTRRENEKREQGADPVVRPADAVADESI